jgi:uncharacterized protein YjbI with pentapeptide repeats
MDISERKDLRRTNLYGANLIETNIEGANLKRTNLEGAQH